MFRKKENAVFESFGYPFIYFCYCKNDKYITDIVPLKLHVGRIKRFSEETIFYKKRAFCCFQLGKSTFRALSVTFRVFLALRNCYNFNNIILCKAKKVSFLKLVRAADVGRSRLVLK